MASTRRPVTRSRRSAIPIVAPSSNCSARAALGPRDRRRAADQSTRSVTPSPTVEGGGARRRGTARDPPDLPSRRRGVEAVQAYLAEVWGEAVARFRLVAENTGGSEPGSATEPSLIEPLRLSFEIDCPPTMHSTSGPSACRAGGPRDIRHRVIPIPIVTLEPRLGGRIYERTSDGTEIDWGEITDWDPPRRLAYLWHIGGTELTRPTSN